MNVQCGYVDGGLIHWPTQADEVRLGSCMLRLAMIWLWLAACDNSTIVFQNNQLDRIFYIISIQIH